MPSVGWDRTVAVSPFEDAASEEFAKTPWFDAKGVKELLVAVGGNFIRKTSARGATRVHEYVVQIPYTDFQSQMRTRQVPYAATEYQCVYNYNVGNICGNVSVTHYRTEYYTVNVPVTRYRPESRAESYSGTEMYQFLGLFLKGRATIGKAPKHFNLTEKSEESGFQHDVSMPNIGLSPQTANLSDPLGWLKAQSQALGAKFKEQANELWAHQYCRAPSAKGSISQQGEQVHRCLRGKPAKSPGFIEAWYRNRLGIDLAEAEQSLGLSSY